MIIVDCETTGLHPRVHRPWEVAIIDLDANTWHRYLWRPSPDLIATASTKALEINGMFDRVPAVCNPEGERVYAEEVADRMVGRVVAGSNPDFDVRMIGAWLGDHGLGLTPHYRTIDIPTLAAGRLLERGVHVRWPLKSYEVSMQLGVDPPPPDMRHQALSDAMWCLRLWQAVTA